MTKQDGGKITLPMQQTVFLPKEAMGIRYIEKIKAVVFIDRLSPAADGLWLRGFYELDLEYQGLEGRGLCKHRVMLPLKAVLPSGWVDNLGCQDIDAGDLHANIKRPMVKLLSPYVLELSAELSVEYLGDYHQQKDKQYKPLIAETPKGSRAWSSNLPMPDEDMPSRRIESKIESFFLGKSASLDAAPEKPRFISSRGILPDEEGLPVYQPKSKKESSVLKNDISVTKPSESSHSLPVWQNIPKEPTVQKHDLPVYVEKSAENPVENTVQTIVEKLDNKAESAGKEQIYVPPLNRNRFRSMLTAAALSKIQARGETLYAEAEAAVAGEHNAHAEQSEKALETEAVNNIREEQVFEMNENLSASMTDNEINSEESAADAAVAVQENLIEDLQEKKEISEAEEAALVAENVENVENQLPAVETMVENNNLPEEEEENAEDSSGFVSNAVPEIQTAEVTAEPATVQIVNETESVNRNGNCCKAAAPQDGNSRTRSCRYENGGRSIFKLAS